MTTRNRKYYPSSLKFAVASLALLPVVGCKSTPVDPPPDTTVQPADNTDTGELNISATGAEAELVGDTLKIEYPVLQDKNDRIPDWVINPGLGGVTGAVGVASIKGLGTKEQLDEARLNARLELASMLEARLQGVGRTELEENTRALGGERSEEARKNLLGVERDILDVVLAGTRQRAIWFDPENDECYVWIVLDGRLLEVVDHYTVEAVSVFVANTIVTTEYRPERRKPVVPQIILTPTEPAAAPEIPTDPIDKVEHNLKPLETIPIKDEDKAEGGATNGSRP